MATRNDIQQDQPSNDANPQTNLLRILSGTTVAIILVAMLGWGLVESIFGQQSGFVAKVGNKLISQSEFGSYVDSLESQFRMSGIVSARPSYIYKMALEDLSMEKMIEQEAERMNLRIEEKAILSYIIDESRRNGTELTQSQLKEIMSRNPEAFKNIINANRKSILIKNLAPVMQSSSYGSNVALENMVRSKLQRRSYTIMRIRKGDAGKTKDPSEEELMQIYNSEPHKFTVPAKKYILAFNTNKVKMEPLSNEEIMQVYNSRVSQNQQTYRNIDLVFTKTKGEAEVVARMLKEGSSTASITEFIPSAKIESFTKSKASDFNSEIGELIFSTPQKEPTKIINVDSGFVVAITNKILKSKEESQSRAISKSERESIENELRCSKLIKAKSKIMEMISSGATFSEITSKFQAKVERLHLDEGGTANSELNLEVAREIQNKPEGYIGMYSKPSKCEATFFVIEKLIPEGKIPFQQIKSQLKSTWKDNLAQKQVSEKYQNFINKATEGGVMKEGKSLEEYARLEGISIVETGSGTYKATKSNLLSIDKSLPKAMFTAKIGKVIGPFLNADGEIIFAVLQEIKYPKEAEIPKEEVRTMQNKLRAQYSKEYAEIYEQYLKSKYKTRLYKPYSDQFAEGA